jgi:stalled ribosome rescue protein Dom34
MKQMAVWIDHNEAKVFHVTADAFDEKSVLSPNHHVHRHPKDMDSRIHNHPDDEHRFFHQLVDVLADADQVLLLGPSVTKLHFLRYVQKHHLTLEPRIVGIETADHPTDRQLVAHVRQYFRDPLPRTGTTP